MSEDSGAAQVDEDAGAVPADDGVDPARSPVQSNWWYVAVAVVAWGGVLTALLALSGAVEPAASAAVPVAYVGLALLLVLPAALYVDGTRVTEAGGEWAPTRTLYAVAAFGGVLFPPLSVGVAALYLLRRHRHVGVP